jgi:hypothetical protein
MSLQVTHLGKFPIAVRAVVRFITQVDLSVSVKFTDACERFITRTTLMGCFSQVHFYMIFQRAGMSEELVTQVTVKLSLRVVVKKLFIDTNW